MADHPLADANVARVAVDNHPLATGVAVSAQPPVAVSPPRRPNVDDANKSLDQLADDFLTLKSSPPIHLKPQPLPKGQVGILRLRTLVERRAWGDVLKLAQTLLHEANSSKHSNLEYVRVYKSLLFQTNESADSVVNGVSNKIQQETLEIMGLKCHALLKLRRYTELQTEVGQWKFLKQNDVHAEVIEWIPWGMRKFCECVEIVNILYLFIYFEFSKNLETNLRVGFSTLRHFGRPSDRLCGREQSRCFVVFAGGYFGSFLDGQFGWCLGQFLYS